MALGANVPLAMRGPAEVASWSPTKIAALDEGTLARITDLYARDPLLSRRLADALESDAIANEAQAAAQADMQTGTEGAPMVNDLVERDAKEKRDYNGRYAETARAAAGFLKRDDGPRVAMFDTTGWDTHANEGGAQGQLALRLRGLDAAMAAFKESLGPVWRNTVVLDRHRVRPHRRHQRHPRDGSRHGRRGVPVRRRGCGWPRVGGLARAFARKPLRESRSQAHARPAYGDERRAARSSWSTGGRAR